MTSVSTLIDLLRLRASERPDDLAYAFLDDGGLVGERLTYGQLDVQARAVATYLQEAGAEGDRALLLFPAGLDFLKAFFGCLYAGVIAIPAPPPEASRLKRTLPRLRAIVEDARASAILSSTETLGLMESSGRDAPEMLALRSLDIRSVATGLAGRWKDPKVGPDVLAYLQYTSGSTTRPKGVMIDHRNVVSHCDDVRAACDYTRESLSVTWLPYFHDYGLIEGLMVPLANGTPCYVMSPFAFLKRPFAWLRAITTCRATHTQAPNFAYDQCVRRIKPEQAAQLDLRSLRSAGNGAEPINPTVIEAFHRRFAPYGLRREAINPAYGLAEATLMVSCSSPAKPPRIGAFRADALGEGRAVEASEEWEPTRQITSCGPPVGEARVLIVDAETRTRRGAGEVGEIWVSGVGVARGYWERPEETAATFRAELADTGEGPFLRTGDLGFLHDGELYVTSRIKDLIIVAGTNHHPQDIEWTVEGAHDALRPGGAAAFPVLVEGEERLAVAAEVERGSIEAEADAAPIFESVRTAVARGHELAVHAILLLARGSLPKTASGKTQRHGCRRLFEEGGADVVACWVADEARRGEPQRLT